MLKLAKTFFNSEKVRLDDECIAKKSKHETDYQEQKKAIYDAYIQAKADLKNQFDTDKLNLLIIP